MLILMLKYQIMLLFMPFMLLCSLQNGLVSCTRTLKLGCKQSRIMLEIILEYEGL